ncbi:EcsC family protein [Sunxiuqinia dokdonensis]|uniref:EcsC family protein n=1 Tax=Sunxiuqinia dokdonensis TaxID=1409788 RepID=A0A0L8V738_9BACT|nr:EcsC family protein [Sunxiuqinia dokdonensis]KOH44148.1 hypothetical protein NC99_31410 [Sunxiuqinia dokdonensis]
MTRNTSGSDAYRKQVLDELHAWQRSMQKKPSILNEATKKLQAKANRIIPEKAHQAITQAIKHTTQSIMTGSGLITPRLVLSDAPLEMREAKIIDRIKFYRSTAAVEGAATGFGGILWGFADLPLWMAIKIKMLFELAAQYGFDTQDYRERIFILYVFQLAFSSQEHRNKVYRLIEDWDKHKLPDDNNQLDWRTYWEEYRDHLDLAKLFQLIPGVGAGVGAVVNYKLTTRLGKFAMNAYRMRLHLQS